MDPIHTAALQFALLLLGPASIITGIVMYIPDRRWTRMSEEKAAWRESKRRKRLYAANVAFLAGRAS
jgi:hypothetical protein